MYKEEYLSEKINCENICTWVLRVEVNEEGCFVQEDTGSNSMVLLYEMAYTVLEYRPNKLILALFPSDMLITDNWEPIQHIHSAAADNIEMNYICCHPDFDE